MNAPVFLTPSVAGLLAQVNAGPPADSSAAGQRAALNGAMAALGWPASAGAVEVIDLASGASVHIFAPQAGATPGGLIVYLHGGSFVAGGAIAHGGLAQALADRTGKTVALVDYRLTPEHPLPAARDDCVEAVKALAARSGFDPQGTVLLGDSAGGWLVAQTAVVLGSTGPRVARLVLVNPMITPHPARSGSRNTFASGYFAGTADFDCAWDMAGGWVKGTVHPGDDTEALAAFPPTIIITNEADPVRDEGEEFAEQLSAVGVSVVNLRARGLIHAAWLFPKALPEADLMLALIAGAS